MSEVLKSLPNMRETSHETNWMERGKMAMKSFFGFKNSAVKEQVSETTAAPAETKPYRHAPDLSRIEDGHTKEEMNKLQKKWEDWLNGGSVLSDNLENTLEAVYDDEKNNWGYDELETFFKNCQDIESNAEKRGTENGETVADSINTTINNLKNHFGRGSEPFKTAAESYVLDIQAGKFKGSRLPYDGSRNSNIIFANKYDEIQKDDEKRNELSINEFYLNEKKH